MFWQHLDLKSVSKSFYISCSKHQEWVSFFLASVEIFPKAPPAPNLTEYPMKIEHL